VATIATNATLLGMALQAANAVAITGGTIDGTVIGGTTPAAGTFTTVTPTSAINSASSGFFVSNGQNNLYLAPLSSQPVGSTANTVYVVQFHLTQPYAIGHFIAPCKAGLASSSANIGIYSFAGTKLIDTGAMATTTANCGAGSAISGTVTSTTLPVGDYWLAFSATDTSTVRFDSFTGIDNAMVYGNMKILGTAANALSGGSLPSTLGTISVGGGFSIPVIVWSY
jgi:hypothetical protein